MQHGGREMLSNGEAAKVLGISYKTLRRWADKGLIAHVLTPTGYRLYDPKVIEEYRRRMERPAVEDPGADNAGARAVGPAG